MPWRRKGKTKKRAKTRKSVNNKPLIRRPKSLMPHSNMYRSKFTHVITLSLYDIQSPNGFVYYTLPVQADLDPKFTEWASVFGQYKVCGISVRLRNQFNVVSSATSQLALSAVGAPGVEIFVLDGKTTAVPPNTREKVLNFRNKRRYQLYQNKTFKHYSPAYMSGQVVNEALGVNTLPVRSKWISCLNGDVNHRSLNLAITNNEGPFAFKDGHAIFIERTVYISYRNERDKN